MSNVSRHWTSGIVFRSLAAVTLITALLGGISSFVARKVVAERVRQEAVVHLRELLDTVESAASVAVYTKDEQLAQEVVQGVLRNGDVLRARIVAGEVSLASAERSPWREEAPPQVRRMLFSPIGAHQIIGEIEIDADWRAVLGRAEVYMRDVTLMLLGQLVLMVIGTGAMVFMVVVRPIKATSDGLHRLDGTRGGRLDVPDSHEHTEIGRLVRDINDLTGRLVATLDQERELRRQQEIAKRMYQDLFDHSSSGIFVAEADGTLLSLNPAFIAMTWIPAKTVEDCRNLLEPCWSDALALRRLLARSAVQQAAGEDDFLLLGAHGDERWLRVAMIPLGNGSVQGTVNDVTERKREELSARRLAVTDSLTGFANRSGLLQAFAELDATRRAPFSLVMVNLNGFKRINDALGFEAGDRILLVVAERLRESGRAEDYFARIGGDEFCLVMAGMGERAAVEARIVELHDRLGAPYPVEAGAGGVIAIGISVGIAFFPKDGADMPQLLRSAELAQNGVRESSTLPGASGYRFFDPELQIAVEYRRRLEDDLRAAVEGEQLTLVFQPIVDLERGRVVGAEALLRWRHDERGFIPPEVFIPLAERVGLIGEIGRQVLEEACRQLARWQREGLDLYVSINVSVRQIPDQLSPQTVLDALARHGLPPHALVIEITEGVLMNDVSLAQRWIEELREAGLRVYLDDFGTGYSSLSYLKRFSMDTVKIDKSFVMDMNADNSDRALVEAIIIMADSLGLNVVAEGVEDASQLRLLREMGCGFGQGFLFSTPVAAEDLSTTVQRIGVELRG